jgi:chaperone BCS1
MFYDVRKRSLDSVFLHDEVKNEVISRIRWFLDHKDWYYERGIPWRIGLLLYGPPGNGKTSFVKAVTSEFDLELHCMHLNSVQSDEDLCCIMGSSQPKVVLLEDIDSYDFTKKRSDQKGVDSKLSLMPGVTMSGLLNAVDGVTPSDGRILFMTTNHRDKLDPALIRPGRIDHEIHVRNATPVQAEAMFRVFFPSRTADQARKFADSIDGSVSMAEVQNRLMTMKDEL